MSTSTSTMAALTVLLCAALGSAGCDSGGGSGALDDWTSAADSTSNAEVCDAATGSGTSGVDTDTGPSNSGDTGGNVNPQPFESACEVPEGEPIIDDAWLSSYGYGYTGERGAQWCVAACDDGPEDLSEFFTQLGPAGWPEHGCDPTDKPCFCSYLSDLLAAGLLAAEYFDRDAHGWLPDGDGGYRTNTCNLYTLEWRVRETVALGAFPVAGGPDPGARVCDSSSDTVRIAYSPIVRAYEPYVPVGVWRPLAPGDFVLYTLVESADAASATLQLDAACVDAGPAAAAECAPAAELAPVRQGFEAAPAAGPTTFAVLVEESGSTKGLVLDGVGHEVPFEAWQPADGNPIDRASDFQGLRWSAVHELIQSVGPEDRVAVFAFGESAGVSRLCPPDTESCWWPRHSGNSGDLNAAVGALDYGGRTPLWEAVATGVEALADEPGSRRVVVVADGPDTCHAESDHYLPCWEPCSTVGRAEALAAAETAGIPVDIVQFESRGYRGQVADLWDLACRSGGFFQFINSEEMSKTFTSTLQDALDDSMIRSWYAAVGHWTADFALPPSGFTASGTQPDRGVFLTLSGSLEVELAGHDLPAAAFNREDGSSVWDDSLAMLRACTVDADCDGSGTECGVTCQAGLCRTPDACVTACP